MAQITTYDPSKARAYRQLSKEMGSYQQEISARFKECQETGDLAKAKNILEAATLRIKEYENFRESLSKEELLLAKYGVEVINEHTILFVIPKGTSRISILEEAHKLVLERDGRHLIHPHQLPAWQKDDRFKQEQETSKRLCIDGHVQGGDGKTRTQQEAFLGKEFRMPEIEDLAVAFSLHWVATGEPLFEWYVKPKEWSFAIRCVGGALDFDRTGLKAVALIDDDESTGIVGVSALVSPE